MRFISEQYGEEDRNKSLREIHALPLLSQLKCMEKNSILHITVSSVVLKVTGGKFSNPIDDFNGNFYCWNSLRHEA